MPDEVLLDGLHAQSGDFFFRQSDPRILAWLREAEQEGDRITQEDPAYPKMDEAMDYVLGRQLRDGRPSYLPSVVINQTKKAIKTHISALTDLRPMFAYKTFNTHFQEHAAMLNRLIVIWWINTFADQDLADALSYALTIGTGDLLIEYDPHLGAGDTRLIPRDPRDLLPFRPTRSRTLQDWEGIIIRESISINRLRGTYPDIPVDLLAPDSPGLMEKIYTRFRRFFSGQVSTPSTLDGLKSSDKPGRGSDAILRRCYLKDRSVNRNAGPVLMGRPGTNWCYTVEPGKPLYPRGRLIVATEKIVLQDGPNPYWHGMFPAARLKLDPWPWLFGGLGLCHDLMPLQNALNGGVNDIIQVISQWVNRTMVADSNAMPESMFKRFDPRKPLSKLKLKATMGEGFKLLDGPQLPPFAFEFLKFLFQKHEDLSEMANLQSLMQLGQMPGADTIDAYYKALTPGLRREGRLIEVFLRDVGQMLKTNIFQFYSKDRRVTILGEQGVTLSDFDFDPGSLVPAMNRSMPGYVPELDKDLSRDKRAEWFHNLFTFYVAPNSILAMHAQEKRMEAIQLSRQGYMDFWTLHERLETPNVGEPPPTPLPMRGWKPPTNERGEVILDPVTGMPPLPPMEVRIPSTITERLLAQNQLGLGQSGNAAGRPASGQQPAQMIGRTDGSITMSESGR